MWTSFGLCPWVGGAPILTNSIKTVYPGGLQALNLTTEAQGVLLSSRPMDGSCLKM